MNLKRFHWMARRGSFQWFWFAIYQALSSKMQIRSTTSILQEKCIHFKMAVNKMQGTFQGIIHSIVILHLTFLLSCYDSKKRYQTSQIEWSMHEWRIKRKRVGRAKEGLVPCEPLDFTFPRRFCTFFLLPEPSLPSLNIKGCETNVVIEEYRHIVKRGERRKDKEVLRRRLHSSVVVIGCHIRTTRRRGFVEWL